LILSSITENGYSLHFPAGLFLGCFWLKLNFNRSPGKPGEVKWVKNSMVKVSCQRCDLRLPWGAYVVTSNDHLQLAREACLGGARIIQYRDKDASTAKRLEVARQIRCVTREHGALFIVNDQIELAMLSEADGVHLGQEDIAIADARSMLTPGMIVGVSCSSLGQALAAERQGADYLGIGAVFATPVKAEYSIVGLELLRRIATEVSIPLVAIGGINLGNMAAVKAAGVSNVAMVREFQNDTAAKVAAVNSFFK
jgi:thiamine-phosphate diphosphorylase